MAKKIIKKNDKKVKKEVKKTTKTKQDKKVKKELKSIPKSEIILSKLSKQELKTLLEKKWLRTNILLEILGAPKEHVEQTITHIVSLISKITPTSVKLLNYEIEKPEEVGKTADGKTDLFGSFAELELMFDKAETLTEFCFMYMPSSIEIVDPVSIELNNKDLSAIFNDLQAKLHAVDKVAKELRSENMVLRRNAGLLLRNNILINLRDGKEKSLEELSNLTGIPTNQLEHFLQNLIKEGFVRKDKNKYSRNI